MEVGEGSFTSNESASSYIDQYKPIVNAYFKLEQSGFITYGESILGDDVTLIPNGPGSYFLQTGILELVYTFYDLNGNDFPELLIGANLGKDKGMIDGLNVLITGIYSLQDGNFVSLIQVGWKSYLGLRTDSCGNCIIKHTIGTQAYYVEEFFYRIDNDGILVTLDKLYTYEISYDEISDESIYRYTKEVNGEEVDIRENEFLALMGKYGSRGVLDYTSDLGVTVFVVDTWKLLSTFK